MTNGKISIEEAGKRAVEANRAFYDLGFNLAKRTQAQERGENEGEAMTNHELDLDDSWELIIGDVDCVFSYSTEQRPQDRAHRYIDEHGVQRVARDTSMQAAVIDMCERAYELGKSERIPELDGMAEEFRAMSVKCMELSVGIGRIQR